MMCIQNRCVQRAYFTLYARFMLSKERSAQTCQNVTAENHCAKYKIKVKRKMMRLESSCSILCSQTLSLILLSLAHYFFGTILFFSQKKEKRKKTLVLLCFLVCRKHLIPLSSDVYSYSSAFIL